MPIVSANAWKAHLKTMPHAHILQTAEWGDLKGAFGWEPLRIQCQGSGAQVLFRKLPLGMSVAYVPKPEPSSWSDEGEALWGELLTVCRQKRAIFLKIEPDTWQGWSDEGRSPLERLLAFTTTETQISGHNIQPPRTIIVDLRGGEDEVLRRMKQKCRYNIRLAEKKGVEVRAWDDLNGFSRLMEVTGGRDGFAVHTAAYYRTAYELFYPVGECELLVAEHGGQPLAALMVFRHGPRAWYLYGASNDMERNRMPTYLLQWRAMQWAMAHGCEDYDLWGVPDEGEDVLEAQFETRQEGLWGVYRFKRGFGGQVRRAEQAIDVVFDPLLYRFYLWRVGSREAA